MAKHRKHQLKSIVVKKDQKSGEKWLKHYASSHKILSVGDGDFSFSLCLAKAFSSASNITATSLDTYDELIRKYKDGKSNVEKLKKLGARLLHGVDATKMMYHTDLKSCKFDRIVFNFPHAGFHGREDQKHTIRMHQRLLSGFFKNSSRMLSSDGEVHVNHKTTQPYCHWNLKELASRNSLLLRKRTVFILDDYPGYNNKRGGPPKCDKSFPIGESSTYKFIISRKSQTPQHQNSASNKHRRPPSLLHYNYHELRINTFSKDADIMFVQSQDQITNQRCTAWMLDGRVSNLLGRTNQEVAISLHEDLRQGYNQYMTESPQRTVNGYLYLLCEFQRRILEPAWLRRMLRIN